MSYTAQKLRVPYRRATFSYSPNSDNGGSDPYGSEGDGFQFEHIGLRGRTIRGMGHSRRSARHAAHRRGQERGRPSTARRLDGRARRLARDPHRESARRGRRGPERPEQHLEMHDNLVPDPSQKPTEIYFSGNRVMQVVSQDVQSQAAIVNGAGDPYNPQVQEALRGLADQGRQTLPGGRQLWRHGDPEFPGHAIVGRLGRARPGHRAGGRLLLLDDRGPPRERSRLAHPGRVSLRHRHHELSPDRRHGR